MKNLKLTTQQAVDTITIPKEYRTKVLEQLAGNPGAWMLHQKTSPVSACQPRKADNGGRGLFDYESSFFI